MKPSSINNRSMDRWSWCVTDILIDREIRCVVDILILRESWKGGCNSGRMGIDLYT
jgi:hypothetical protein